AAKYRSMWSLEGVVQAQTVASIRTCLPAAKAVPSTLVTLRRSLLSSLWKVPAVPSAQAGLPMVLGWLGSGPLPSRPRSSAAPESQERPTTEQRGACSVASKVAITSGGGVVPPATANTRSSRSLNPPAVQLALVLLKRNWAR